MGLSRGFYMTVYFDANNIYDAGTKAMQSSKFKHSTQLFEMNHLLTTAHIRQDFITGNYKPDPGNKFPISERGHPRYITSNTMVDKTVNHLLCDEVLTPSISKYLIYDNGASQKGKGVAFHRRRFEARLHQYFMQNGTNRVRTSAPSLRRTSASSTPTGWTIMPRSSRRSKDTAVIPMTPTQSPGPGRSCWNFWTVWKRRRKSMG